MKLLKMFVLLCSSFSTVLMAGNPSGRWQRRRQRGRQRFLRQDYGSAHQASSSAIEVYDCAKTLLYSEQNWDHDDLPDCSDSVMNNYYSLFCGLFQCQVKLPGEYIHRAPEMETIRALITEEYGPLDHPIQDLNNLNTTFHTDVLEMLDKGIVQRRYQGQYFGPGIEVYDCAKTLLYSKQNWDHDDLRDCSDSVKNNYYSLFCALLQCQVMLTGAYIDRAPVMETIRGLITEEYGPMDHPIQDFNNLNTILHADVLEMLDKAIVRQMYKRQNNTSGMEVYDCAKTLLYSEQNWDHDDLRDCSDSVKSNYYSLFCALLQCQVMLTGEYIDRAPVMETVRGLITEEYGPLDNPIQDFNNLNTILHADVLEMLNKAIVRQRYKNQNFGSGIEVYDCAKTLLYSEQNWDHDGLRDCSDSVKSSLFCALLQCQVMLTGEYIHRAPVMETIRGLITEEYGSLDHPIQDFNNLNTILHADVLEMLDKAIVRQRYKRQDFGPGIEVYDCAKTILYSEQNWDHDDLRDCSDSVMNNYYSLFCALLQCQVMLTGEYIHRAPVMETIRGLITEEFGFLDHPIQDFNNLNTILHADVLEMLDKAIVRQRYQGQYFGSGIEVYDCAKTLLYSEQNWDHDDLHDCSDSVKSNYYSLFCALLQCQVMLTGEYIHRAPVMETIRGLITEEYGPLDNPIQDFNNLNTILHADVLEMLDKAIVRQRYKRQNNTSGIEVYDCAKTLLYSEQNWEHDDLRDCSDSVKSNYYSLFCALLQCQVMLTGEYIDGAPVMETIRGLITEEYGPLDHPIQDFNNLNTILHADVLEMLNKAIVRQRYKSLNFGSGIEVYDCAKTLLYSEQNWDHDGLRDCSDSVKSSLFCALLQCQVMLTGEYIHRAPEMETIRGLITEEYGSLDHPIQDFNNLNTILHADVLEMLDKAIVRQRYQGQYFGSGIEVYDCAKTLLYSEQKWDHDDLRDCSDSVKSNYYSLFCALLQCQVMLTGEYIHRAPVMETIRGLITEEYGPLNHPIQDFNNLNTILHADVLEMLNKAIVRRRYNRQDFGSGIEVYDSA